MKFLIKGLLLLVVILFSQTLSSQILINEYSCANATSAGDPDFYGQMEDWVELYNPTAAAINLNGYYLSDKAGNPTKFQIPGSITIPAGGYMMVYASGRATIAGGTEIHTNFKLTQTKFEKIILSNPGGTVIDILTIKTHQLLHSRGRTTSGAGTWSVFTNPTPNGPNTGAMLEYATTPIFNVAPGFYSSTQSVSITSPDVGVTIRYTTDGTEPTASSIAYTGPINVSTTQVIRARSFSSNPNIPPSFIETNTYFINSNHTVPVISICGDNILNLLNGSQIEPMGALEFFDRAGVMKTEVTGDFNKHGNDSWAYDQRGLDFISRDQHGYNHALTHQLFPQKSRDEFQRIILKPGASDNYPFENGGAHIRDPFVHTLSQLGDLKLDERTYDACVLYVNGQYWGVYETREKVDDSDFTSYYYDQEEQYRNSPNYIQYLSTWGGTNTEYGAPNAQPNWDSFVNFVTTNNMAIPANFNYVDSVYNWQSLIDYFCLNSYIVNKDWLNWNTSWWRGLNPAGDKKKWRYSLWDMDATFGHYTNYTGIPDVSANADPCNVENLPNPGGEGHTEIMVALMDNPIFEQYYISRYIDLGNTVFSCDNMIPLLDSLVGMIAPEMPGQVARWGGSVAQWQNNVQAMRDFILDRCVAIDDGLVDCYNLSGPYPVKFNVNPTGGGNIKINSTIPPNYVFTGDYFGGIDILLKAIPDSGYMFSHWEIFNHTLDSALTNDENSLQITQADSIIAHFIVIDSTRLVFNVFPAASGNISIDGYTPPTYSYSDYFTTTSTINLIATPQPGYIFDHWESLSTAFAPDQFNDTVQITANLADSIVAHFVVFQTFDVKFNVTPVGGGNIAIDGVTPATYVHTQNYTTNSIINLIATPLPGYVFDHWTSLSTAFIPDTLNDTVQITVNMADSIVAHFVVFQTFDIKFNVTPVGGGNIAIDGVTPATYVHTQNYTTNSIINLIATPLPGYVFDHWESLSTAFVPNQLNDTVQVTVNTADSIVAYFVLIQTFDLKFNVNPIGGGNISINGVTPATYVHTQNNIINDELNLVATPLSGYIFDHWESTTLGFSPSTLASTVSITVTASDSIIAHFTYIDTFDITYNVMPIGAGDIAINTVVPIGYPHTESYIENTTVNLKQFELLPETYSFDHWESIHHTLSPSTSSSTVTFQALSDDTIIAVYIDVPPPPTKGAQLPAAFSPNGDGNNDMLFVYGGQIVKLSLSIYDRWGELVFETSSQDNGWDGTYKGKEASSGVYVYKLEVVYADKEKETKSGNITLIR
ncbi:MAG: CotH kinase family protein [Bacteroidetes bacterium]|nr:CotH kinase family protein [Bacteroidota bacterium]